MKAKKITAIACCALLMLAGLFAAITMYTSPHTYEGEGHDMTELYENPSIYDGEKPSGVAEEIIDETLEKTNAVNAVTAVVFDFRGFDTMGESFILITAISGSLVILRKIKKGGHADHAGNETEH